MTSREEDLHQIAARVRESLACEYGHGSRFVAGKFVLRINGGRVHRVCARHLPVLFDALIDTTTTKRVAIRRLH